MKTRGPKVYRINPLPGDIVCCVGCSTNLRLENKIVRFLDFKFCNVNCFGKYFFDRQRCHYCKDLICDKTMQILTSTTETLKFCDLLCMELYKAIREVCWICSVAARDVSRRNPEFCSHRCEEFHRRATGKMKIQKCEQCFQYCQIEKQVKIDYKNVNLCSDTCFNEFIKYHKLRLKMCITCNALFEMHIKHFIVMNENGFNMQFCSQFCLKYFVNNIGTEAVCKRCERNDAFHKMIKVYDEIYCSIACLFNGKNVVEIIFQQIKILEECFKIFCRKFHFK